jgi:hypothetical protein
MDYYLDFIDSANIIEQLGVDNIGCRTFVLNDDKINCLFEDEIPDLILISQSDINKEEK